MPRRPRTVKNRTRAAAPPRPAVVGPDYMQILKGTLAGRDMALILCGESHEDALDVTRSAGRFDPEEGWINAKLEDLVSLSTEKTSEEEARASNQKDESPVDTTMIHLETSSSNGGGGDAHDEEEAAPALVDHQVVHQGELELVQQNDPKPEEKGFNVDCLGPMEICKRKEKMSLSKARDWAE